MRSLACSSPGGRLAVSDIVLLRELPASVREAAELYASCIPGAALKEEYLAAMNTAGLCDVTVVDETPFPAELVFSDGLSEVIVRDLRLTPEDLAQAASSAVSIKVTARASSGIGWTKPSRPPLSSLRVYVHHRRSALSHGL